MRINIDDVLLRLLHRFVALQPFLIFGALGFELGDFLLQACLNFFEPRGLPGDPRIIRGGSLVGAVHPHFRQTAKRARARFGLGARSCGGGGMLLLGVDVQINGVLRWLRGKIGVCRGGRGGIASPEARVCACTPVTQAQKTKNANETYRIFPPASRKALLRPRDCKKKLVPGWLF